LIVRVVAIGCLQVSDHRAAAVVKLANG
jgi:hypothetical protein